jgi:hypothetical protein
MDNPVAMPAPYGYDYDNCDHDVVEFFKRAKLVAAQYDNGMEDPGDSLSKQIGGTHYKKGVQPWTIALDWGLDPWSHNVVKYILRFPYKNGREDLEKIQHYLEFLIDNYDDVVDKYYK